MMGKRKQPFGYKMKMGEIVKLIKIRGKGADIVALVNAKHYRLAAFLKH